MPLISAAPPPPPTLCSKFLSELAPEKNEEIILFHFEKSGPQPLPLHPERARCVKPLGGAEDLSCDWLLFEDEERLCRWRYTEEASWSSAARLIPGEKS